MIKKIIAGLCLLLSTVAFAQENNASPYSFYGVGDVKFKGTVENRSMGGVGILPDSIHINLQNPATYSALKFTTFAVGGTTSSTNFKTNDASDTAGRTTLDYVAVALPFKKIGVAFGLMPYTAVGYRVSDSIVSGTDGLTRYRQFRGSGGLNRVFFGAAYKITPQLSIGAEFQYNFGNIETRSVVGVPGVQYATREINTSDYKGAGFNVGATYQALLNKKYTWTLSAVYTPEISLDSNTTRNTATITTSSSGSEAAVNQLTSTLSSSDSKLPSKFSAGTGIGQVRSWFAGVEYTYQQSNKIGNRLDNVSTTQFKNSSKISLGGYFIPKYMSYTSYLSRVTYRAGLKYEKTGLVIAGEDINDMGISLGAGLPLSGTIGCSNLNIGLEYGKRGTKNAGLVQENYFSVFIGLSLNDKWFVKRRYE